MPSKYSTATLLALVGLAILTCGCGPHSLAGDWEYKEIARIKSPDPAVEAVLFTGDAGATTSTTSQLYIVPAGSRIDPKKTTENGPHFVADHVKKLNVIWKNPRLLEISYEEARIRHFRNDWSHKEVQSFHFVVELRLAPGTNEFSLPVGDRIW